MSVEEDDVSGQSDTDAGDQSSEHSESIGGLLSELLSGSDSTDSRTSDPASLTPGAAATVDGATVGGDESDVEDGIVSSLLDELMASAPKRPGGSSAASDGASDDFDGDAELEDTESDDQAELPDPELEDPELEDADLEDPELEDADLLEAEVEAPEPDDTETSDPEPKDSELPDAELEDSELDDTNAGEVVDLEDIQSEDPESANPDLDKDPDVGALLDELLVEEPENSPLEHLLDDGPGDEARPDTAVEVGPDIDTGLDTDTGLDLDTDQDSDATIVVAPLTNSSDLDETAILPEEDLDATEVITAAPGEATILDTDDGQDDGPSIDKAKTGPPVYKGLVREGSAAGRLAKGLLVAAVVLFVIVGGAWAVDMAVNQGKVLRGTTLAGESIVGFSSSQLEEVVAERTQQLSSEPLDVSIGDVTVSSDPVTLGVELDESAIVDDALKAGRDGFFLFRPFTWIGRFFSNDDIEEHFAYNNATSTEAAETTLVAPLAQVEEPDIAYRGNRLVLEPGAIGTVVDSQELIDKLPPIMEAGAPYTMTLSAVDDRPNLTDEQVAAVAEEINNATSEPVAVRVLDDVAVIETDRLRELSQLDNNEDGEASWSVNPELALGELQPLFPSLGSEDQQAKFVVVDDEPRIIPASETVICCDDDSAERIRNGLDARPLGLTEEEVEELDSDDPADRYRVIELEPVIVGADEGVAELESLGIIEEVSTFTTNHPCCQNRVTNIQRFADLMQGAIIRPGETISLNESVGQRTREKGFVADGAINLGVIEPQVGGGISQYATTFFNASFFAGLEFIEYQSHSLYISRYPRGREATISWRRPDLKVKNTTPYGVLVWNSYTSTSITVTFYSTKHLEVEALPLRRSSERQCRVDITPRLITYPDGSETEDSVFALYRPGSGLDCNGNSTRPQETTAETPPDSSTPPTDTPEAPGADDTSGETEVVEATVPAEAEANGDGVDDAVLTSTTAPSDGDA